MSSKGLNKVRLDIIQDIARRVGEDIRDLEQATDHWGNEDWSDALADVATLYQFAAAQMLYNAQGPDQPERLQQFHQLALDEATTDAQHSLDNLTKYGFSYTIHDLMADPIDSL